MGNIVTCPTHPARPFENIIVNKFVTPYNEEIIQKATELLNNSDKTREGIIVSCFDFVSKHVKYIPDKWQHGYPEWWMLPRETLKSGIGDCEDSSFLLDSLILSTFHLSSMGSKYDSRVAIGIVSTSRGTGGHAWVESQYGNLNEWHILESTSDSFFKIGENVITTREGYNLGYQPEWYIYEDGCEKVSSQPLYKHYPLLRPRKNNLGHNLVTRIKSHKKVAKKKEIILEEIWTS